VRCLYTVAVHCGFHDKNEEIRDQLALGLADKKLTLELQLRADLSLEIVIQMARERELIIDQMGLKEDHSTIVEEVSRQKGKKIKQNISTLSQDQVYLLQRFCTSGLSDLAAKAKRYRCMKMGHHRRCCRV